MKYPNVLWAISQTGNRYKFAAMIGHSESWLSRRLLGRVPFAPEEQQIIATALGYPADWLFQELQPPACASTPGSQAIPNHVTEAQVKHIPAVQLKPKFDDEPPSKTDTPTTPYRRTDRGPDQ